MRRDLVSILAGFALILFLLVLGVQMVLLEINNLCHDIASGKQQTPYFAGKNTVKMLREIYLSTVVSGLLGGLNHAAVVDVKYGSNSDPAIANRCLMRDWTTGDRKDFCIIKWDGHERLMRVKDLYEKILREGVEGDLMECGVWRGGITIFMKALTRAYEDTQRTVWVSDSFSGVPDTDQQDKHSEGVPESVHKLDKQMWGGHISERAADGSGVIEKNKLTVEEELVADNFRRFGLYDNSVKFVKRWFSETLPTISQTHGLKKLALLRIDGDLYSSTMDVLVNLYPFVSSGGYIIFDDYNIEQSRLATHDFFKKAGLDRRIIQTDRASGPRVSDCKPHCDKADGAYFRKP